MNTPLFLFALTCLLPDGAAGQSESALAGQVVCFPQEKIHVTTDKEHYLTGDTIRFRVHVVDAMSHRPVLASKYVYAELLDAEGSLYRRIRILQQNDLYTGYLPLEADLPEGDYTLTAYTRHQLNQEPAYFFRKLLHIDACRPVERSRSRQRRSDEFDVGFFPEGGHLIAGTPCTVACKALAEDGLSVPVEGRIVDETGSEICTFRTGHAGMGRFVLTAEAEKRYHALCRTGNGSEKRFALPAATSDAVSLHVVQDDSLVIVMQRTTLPAGQMRIAAQCRGRMICDEKWPATTARFIFRRATIPEGVIQLLLLDPQGNALSERLVFNTGTTRARSVVTATPDSALKAREKVTLDIRVTDAGGKPLDGDFALAVTDRTAVAAPAEASIYASLLLCSELKGHIESPDWYFDSPGRLSALDDLLLTQGWRRYDVPEALKGNAALPQIPFEQYQAIEGRIVKEGIFGRRRKLKRYKLTALVPRFGGIEQTGVDDDGSFRLTGFDYPDSTTFVLRALADGSVDRQATLRLVPPSFAQIAPLPAQRPAIGDTADNARDAAATARQYVAWAGNGDMRNVMLDAVVVSAERQMESDKLADRSRPEFRKATHTMTDQVIKRNGIGSILQAIMQMPGIVVKGSTLFYQQKEVLIAVDGSLCATQESFSDDGWRLPLPGVNITTTDETENARAIKATRFAQASDLFTSVMDLPVELQYPIEYVSRIDLLDPTSAHGIWGGDNGVVSITLKSDDEWNALQRESLRTDITLLKPLGYQTPVAWYVPAYDTPQALKSPVPDFRTTLYWNPAVKAIGGRAQATFYLNDAAAGYRICAEGVCGQHVVSIRSGE